MYIELNNKNELTINTNGKHGAEGASGNSGSGGGYYSQNGEDGANGKRGQDGTHAENIILSLSANETRQQVKINVLSQGEYHLPLGDEASQIIVKATGGQGGKGGRGGEGGRGSNGTNGEDASAYSSGTNGTNGGHGGDGGRGGDGGNGGDGADLTVKVQPQDTDLLMLLAKPQLKGGIGGGGARGGEGGPGGSKGLGGNSYYWTEEITHHDTDEEGHVHERIEYITNTTYGGYDGNNGSGGSDGNQGIKGKDGRDGKFKVEVNDNIYSGLYDLSLASIKPVSSDDHIIEPGESLFIKEIAFKNTGVMPTPAYQAIMVSLIPNEWIDFEEKNTILLADSIDPAQESVCKQSLQFHIKKPIMKSATHSAFHATGKLQFKANLARVNKTFPTVATKIKTLQIQYPVEMSTALIAPTISKDEEAPFVVQIQNISQQTIGFAADQPRLLEISLSTNQLNQGKSLSFYNEEGELVQKIGVPVTKNVVKIDPGQVLRFAGTLKFANDVPIYTTINLEVKLHLGDLNKKLSDVETIQQRNVQLQLSDVFNYDPHADFVLVTNNKTNLATIQQWQEKAKELGSSIGIWNTSLYNGVSYTQKRLDQGSFIQQMQGKVIVILNNEMQIRNNTLHSTDCLDAMEILNAAKNAQVASYIIGPDFNLKKAITPYIPMNANSHDITVKEKLFFWQQPSETHLKKVATTLNKRLQKENPNLRYVPLCTFYPKQLSESCFKLTWGIGAISMRETLDQSQSHIAFRKTYNEQSIQELTQIDTYNIIKLLPFHKKIHYLHRTNDLENKEIIKKAILSDLINELLTYGRNKWNNNFTNKKLLDALVNLRYMVQSFSGDLNDVLLKYEYLSSRLPATSDKLFFPYLCRRTRLNNLVYAITNGLLAKAFSKNNLKDARQNLKQMWDQISREEILDQFAFPYNDKVMFDNQLVVSDPIFVDINKTLYKSKESTFKEQQHFFANKEERKKSIASYQARCRF